MQILYGTEIKAAETKLKFMEELELSILDAIPHAVLGLKSRRIIFANDVTETVFGWAPSEIIGSTTRVFYRTDEDFRQVEEQIYAILKQNRTCSLNVSCRHKEGRDILCRLTGSVIGPVLKEDAIVVVFEDVTVHRQMEESLRQSEEKYRSILANIEEAYYEVDLKGNLTFFNDALMTGLGYSLEELKEMNYRQFIDQTNANVVFHAFKEVFGTGIATKQFDWELIKKNGEKVIAEASISLMRNEKGAPVGFRGIVRDVTNRKRVEEMIKNMAYHDSLTGLPNRRLLRDRLDMAIAQAGRHHGLFAVVMMDLDKFKEINDSFGHNAGDQLLQGVAVRMKELLRKGDTIARIGGDEFMLLLLDLKQRQDGIDVIERIRDAFKESFALEKHIISITASIGMAFYPDDGQDSESLMKVADSVMYCAKRQFLTKNPF
jgi:diguanylate cyclase (GGDEF)-like protein/PAS domain S-box-containing protein